MKKNNLGKMLKNIGKDENIVLMEIGIYFEKHGIRVEGGRDATLDEAFQNEFGKKYLKIRDKYEKKIGDIVSEYDEEIRVLLNNSGKFGHYSPRYDMPEELKEILDFLQEKGFVRCDCDDCEDCDCDCDEDDEDEDDED